MVEPPGWEWVKNSFKILKIFKNTQFFLNISKLSKTLRIPKNFEVFENKSKFGKFRKILNI